VRSPSKSTLLAHAAREVGRGRGFAVHKALDQVGAFAGPLLVAGIVALAGAVWAGLAALAVPGAVAMVLLLWLRARTPHLGRTAPADEADPASAPVAATASEPLPRRFYLFATASAASTLGLMTFGVISFHLVDSHLVRAAVVPVVYASAMAAAAFAALATGFAYDRVGARVLLTLPFLVGAVPVLALAGQLGVAVLGVLVWGAATGVQESTVKALVADLVPTARLATAYGVFAAFEGAAALAGGGLAGWLYAGSRWDLVVVLLVAQALSLTLLVLVFRALRAPAAPR
jgi:MFS-type transporter involved in bile tolerance (Atg22 family)